MNGSAIAKPVGETSAWHAITVDEVLKRLTTSTEQGLNASAASTRLQKYGLNRLPEGKTRGPFKRFLSQFNHILVYVRLPGQKRVRNEDGIGNGLLVAFAPGDMPLLLEPGSAKKVPKGSIYQGWGQGISETDSYSNVTVVVSSSHGTVVVTVKWRHRTCTQ